MVYRGKPSAGCENCRKAKKRCTLEQPACARCVKLKKDCTGYRDTTSLQIQDETQDVTAKANRHRPQSFKARASTAAPSPAQTDFGTSVLTPAATQTDSTPSSDDTMDMPTVDREMFSSFSVDDLSLHGKPFSPSLVSALKPGFKTLKPTPDEMAFTHFFQQFTSSYHWDYLRGYVRSNNLDPCLGLAIRACGMAALDNVENVVMGSQYARALYANALRMLNASLRDPKKCRKDECLIAVAMLGYFENLTCDSRESIQSWKTHMAGATQLLKLRGKGQLSTDLGRLLFRESRAQILIHCIWDDLDPPEFVWDWQPELERQTPTIAKPITRPVDKLTEICFEFAKLRADLAKGRISDFAGARVCADIDQQMIQWSCDALDGHPVWRYSELEVPDSPDVWNGMVHSFVQTPAPGVWNMYRGVRILITRSQELLCRRMKDHFSDAEREQQHNYFRKVRRKLTDEICAGVPSRLGHASPAYNSPCRLVSAYNCIWPLFFAGTCTLERIGPDSWEATLSSLQPLISQRASAASAQAAWILGRLEFISRVVGLKWAEGIAAVLRGDFRMHIDLLPEDTRQAPWLREPDTQKRPFSEDRTRVAESKEKSLPARGLSSSKEGVLTNGRNV